MIGIRQTRILACACAAVACVFTFSTDAADRTAATSRGLGPALETSRTLQTDRVRAERRLGTAVDSLRFWNTIAVDASGLDHTPPAAGETRDWREQLGPGRSSRAMAIVHIAMFPAQRADFDQLLATDLRQIRTCDRASKERGIETGRRAAAAILAKRANDGDVQDDPLMNGEYDGGDGAAEWRQDPISLIPIALGADWGAVKPFVLRSPSQFRTPAPPPMESEAYTTAYNEVKALGGDGITTPTLRNEEQTQIGIYWAYDGTPSLCAPPRLYNQIANEIAKRSNNVIRLARFYALIHTAMADAGIAIWESKYYYKFWRPVTGIREADPGTGPSGAGDGNPLTIGDPEFSPLGAPASNLTGPNFTPPFPAYASGHAGFGGALFQTLRNVYGTDRIAFTFVSDELNGVTLGNDGQVRPLVPRSFDSFSQAEEENGQSRIYLGIHWEFDKTEGIRQGRRVANYVYRNAFQPER